MAGAGAMREGGGGGIRITDTCCCLPAEPSIFRPLDQRNPVCSTSSSESAVSVKLSSVWKVSAIAPSLVLRARRDRVRDASGQNRTGSGSARLPTPLLPRRSGPTRMRACARVACAVRAAIAGLGSTSTSGACSCTWASRSTRGHSGRCLTSIMRPLCQAVVRQCLIDDMDTAWKLGWRVALSGSRGVAVAAP